MSYFTSLYANIYVYIRKVFNVSCSLALSESWSTQWQPVNPNRAVLQRSECWSLHARVAGPRVLVETSVETTPICSGEFQLGVEALHKAVFPSLKKRPHPTSTKSTNPGFDIFVWIMIVVHICLLSVYIGLQTNETMHWRHNFVFSIVVHLCVRSNT